MIKLIKKIKNVDGKRYSNFYLKIQVNEKKYVMIPIKPSFNEPSYYKALDLFCELESVESNE